MLAVNIKDNGKLCSQVSDRVKTQTNYDNITAS